MIHLLYHANCADGFASACIALHALTTQQHIPADQIRLQAINYQDKGQAPEKWTIDDHIYYLDYTPPQETLDMYAGYGSSFVKLTIIDHHATAAARHQRDSATGLPLVPEKTLGFESVFSLKLSGAELTWVHFHPTTDLMPDAVKLIGWRDLGHAFQQAGHRYTQPAFDLHATLMRATPRTPEAWIPILLTHSIVLLRRDLDKGRKLRAFDADIIDIAALRPLRLDFPSFPNIPAITGVSPELVSEALSKVLEYQHEAPFAASWYMDATTGLFTYSLRSRKGGPNVGELAATFAPGGGGHPCAAGFSTPTPIPFAS